MDTYSSASLDAMPIFLFNIIIVLRLITRLYFVSEYVKLLGECIILLIDKQKRYSHWTQKAPNSQDECHLQSNSALMRLDAGNTTGIRFPKSEGLLDSPSDYISYPSLEPKQVNFPLYLPFNKYL